MSEISTVFGCIFGIPPTYHFAMEAFEHNQKVIQGLPANGNIAEGILVSSAMFGVPMPLPVFSIPFYKYQMIHFGMSMNHLCDYWHIWIEQFENVLRQLYWQKAYVYMSAQWCSYHTEYVWIAEPIDWKNEPFRTSDKWTFTGGERSFEDWDK